MKLTEAELSKLLSSNPDLEAPQLPGRERVVQQPTEEEEQAAVLAWAEQCVETGEHPELALLYHIPNGGMRDVVTALTLKRTGVKAGVPDLHLPVGRRGKHGLWIELKRANRSNHPTPNQAWWIGQLNAHGHLAVVCYGATEAIEAIKGYLE